MIKRRLMLIHINDECGMKQIICNQCKENVLRKDMDKHQKSVCKERLIICPFSEYGCNNQIKYKLLDQHVSKEKVNHLEIKVYI